MFRKAGLHLDAARCHGAGGPSLWSETLRDLCAIPGPVPGPLRPEADRLAVDCLRNSLRKRGPKGGDGAAEAFQRLLQTPLVQDPYAVFVELREDLADLAGLPVIAAVCVGALWVAPPVPCRARVLRPTACAVSHVRPSIALPVLKKARFFVKDSPQ